MFGLLSRCSRQRLPEVQRLIAQAKQWAEILGQASDPLGLGQAGRLRDGNRGRISGGRAAYRDNHFLRDAAKPVLDADSHAKVRMRKKVRWLRD